MKTDLKDVKTCVFGIQGSGKTYLTENFLLKNFKKPFIFRVHKEDFNKTKKNTYIYDCKKIGDIEELRDVVRFVIQLSKERKFFDCFILDEADLYLKSMVALPPELTDLILNHRHYNLGLIFITRRPQSIPTEIVESSEHLFTFKIEGENVERKLKAIHPDFKELLPKIDKEKHNFIYKKIGEKPRVIDAIKIKRRSKKQNEQRKKRDLPNS